MISRGVTPEVLIVRTGLANLASVRAAFQRLGSAVTVTAEARAVADARLLVLPGVGSYGEGVAALDAAGVRNALSDRVAARRPTLAICLGMQLLCERSEEAPAARGLGAIEGRITRFEDARWVPQLGWNQVRTDTVDGLVRGGHAYFAHSYRLPHAPDGWTVSWSEAGGPFVAAVEDGPVLACQFHPELSGRWGQELLGRWMQRALEANGW